MSRRGIGKVIERLKVDVVGVQVVVQIRMKTSAGQTTFFVDEPDLGIQIEDADLAKVRNEARTAAEGSIQCDWEDCFQVYFSREIGSRYSRDPKTKIETNFHWKTIQIGTRGNGSKCWRDKPSGDHWEDRHIRVKDGEPDSIRLSEDDDDTIEVIISATPEAEAGLNRLLEALKVLSQGFIDLLSGKQAATSLVYAQDSIDRVFEEAKHPPKPKKKASRKKGRR